MSADNVRQAAAPTLPEVEAFLYLEAALLDAGQYAEWGRLFDDDGEYWLPATAGQESPLEQVSHIYENSLLREIRIARFSDPAAWSLQPTPRSSHMVSNIRLDEDLGHAGCWAARSRFVVAQFHRDRQTLFAGEYIHQLRYNAGTLRIKQKRVNLVSCEGIQGDIVVYL